MADLIDENDDDFLGIFAELYMDVFHPKRPRVLRDRADPLSIHQPARGLRIYASESFLVSPLRIVVA